MEKNPFQIIAANYSGFSKVFRRIADSVLEHPDQVLASNIHQLGRELEIAESSIVRFCKALGYSGFSELKLMLAKYGRQSSKIIFENLKDGSPEAVSPGDLLPEHRDAPDRGGAAGLLRHPEGGRYAQPRGAHRDLRGWAASASVAESFAAHLLRIGIAAEASTDGELMQMTARGADARTLFVAITKSGRNLPLVRAFELAKARGAMTVCLTGFEQTPIERFCDVRIVHYCPSTILMSSRIVQSTIIDCLCINAVIQRKEEAERIYAEKPGGPLLPQSVSRRAGLTRGTRKARGPGSRAAPGPAGICSFQNVWGGRLSCSAAPPGSRGPGGTGSACP